MGKKMWGVDFMAAVPTMGLESGFLSSHLDLTARLLQEAVQTLFFGPQFHLL